MHGYGSVFGLDSVGLARNQCESSIATTVFTVNICACELVSRDVLVKHLSQFSLFLRDHAIGYFEFVAFFASQYVKIFGQSIVLFRLNVCSESFVFRYKQLTQFLCFHDTTGHLSRLERNGTASEHSFDRVLLLLC